jgi:multiple antibiotic resistance protein
MPDTLMAFLRVVLLALAALLPIINPPGVAPIFLSMTPGASEALRTTLAARIARNSFILLVSAMLIGSYVLILFGLSLAVIKIAGGILVITTAWHLIRADNGGEAVVVTPASPQEYAASHGFYPLTFPLTIGPGALSVAVTLGAGVPVKDATPLTAVLGGVAGIVLVSCAVYLCFRFASRLLRVLGSVGRIVLLRLSAFILLSIGVKILCDGIVERFIK